MKGLSLALKRLSLGRVLHTSRRCPSTVTTSWPECQQNNCFTVLVIREGSPFFVVKALKADVLQGIYVTGNIPSDEGELRLRDLGDDRFRVSHFWRHGEIRYESLASLVFGLTCPIHYVKRILIARITRVGSFFSNRRRLVGFKRMQVLKQLVDQTVTSEDLWTMPIFLITEIHGSQWASHPLGDRRLSELTLYLDSLVVSGDALRADDYTYRASPKALITIDQFEVEEGRHEQAVKVQTSMLWLTFVLIIIGIMQAGIGLLQAEVIKLPVLLDFTSKPSP